MSLSPEQSCAVHFVAAMSLDIPTEPHPNKLPFKGVMTKVGVASDKAPEGTRGKRTLITKKAAKAALGSLLGMAVDYVAGLDGHDPQAKIGIVTAADIEGEDLAIEGFFYAADFPELVQRIKRDKATLGFSYEAQVIDVEDREADPWVITRLIFTGAAVLRKDKAAYQTTSLAASAAEDISMDEKALAKMIADAVAAAVDPLKKQLDEQDKLRAKTSAVVERVRKHADAMHSLADAMEADGVGCHSVRGHVNVLRKMAGHMMAEASLGKVPHIYDDTGWLHTSAEAGVSAAGQAKIDELKDLVGSLTTQVKDLTAKVQAGASGGGNGPKKPERKTAPANVQAAISKYSLEQDEEGLIDHKKLSEALEKAGIKPGERISVINQFRLAGMLKAAA